MCFFLVCISKHDYIKSFSGFMMKVCKVHMSEFSAPVDESMNLDQPLQQEMGGCAQLLQAAGNDSPDDSESYVFFLSDSKRYQLVLFLHHVTNPPNPKPKWDDLNYNRDISLFFQPKRLTSFW